MDCLGGCDSNNLLCAGLSKIPYAPVFPKCAGLLLNTWKKKATASQRLAQKVVDNLGGGAKSSRFLGPCTEKIELGILIEEVSPRSTNIQSERVAFYLTSQLDFLCTRAKNRLLSIYG
jgi:hypothetical protein